jgi:hypothetical protein
VSYIFSAAVALVVSPVLSVYFLWTFFTRKSAISLVWSSGFALFTVGVATCIYADVSGSGVGSRSLLVAGIVLVILSAYSDSDS